MRQAESPALLVVRGNIRDGLGLLRQTEEMLIQFSEGHLAIHGSRVADDVKIVAPEVHNAAAARVGDESIADAPLLRDGPIKDRGTGRNLVNLQRDKFSQDTKRFTNSGASDAAADR